MSVHRSRKVRVSVLKKSTKDKIVTVIYHIFVMGIGISMVYPLIWMVFSSFKPAPPMSRPSGWVMPRPALSSTP